MLGVLGLFTSCGQKTSQAMVGADKTWLGSVKRDGMALYPY